MPLRIAFDLDGVLADMESELVRQARILFGDAVAEKAQEAGDSPAEPPAAAAPSAEGASDDAATRQAAAESSSENVPAVLKINMTSRQQRKLWRHVESIENFWQTLQEIEPGAVARLAAIAAERRWEIIFLTKRPETAGTTAQLQSQRWLKANGFALPSVYVVQRSRGKIAAALGLDVVVDDRPENCLDVVVDSKARAILVRRTEETQVPGAARRLGIGVVKSVNECLDILAQLDAGPTQPPGVVERMMRLLGLKEPANA